MATYYAANEALLRNWNEAVGEALSLRLRVTYPGGSWKGLGELREEIVLARAGMNHEVTFSGPGWCRCTCGLEFDDQKESSLRPHPFTAEDLFADHSFKLTKQAERIRGYRGH